MKNQNSVFIFRFIRIISTELSAFCEKKVVFFVIFLTWYDYNKNIENQYNSGKLYLGLELKNWKSVFIIRFTIVISTIKGVFCENIFLFIKFLLFVILWSHPKYQKSVRPWWKTEWGTVLSHDLNVVIRFWNVKVIACLRLKSCLIKTWNKHKT